MSPKTVSDSTVSNIRRSVWRDSCPRYQHIRLQHRGVLLWGGQKACSGCMGSICSDSNNGYPPHRLARRLNALVRLISEKALVLFNHCMPCGRLGRGVHGVYYPRSRILSAQVTFRSRSCSDPRSNIRACYRFTYHHDHHCLHL